MDANELREHYRNAPDWAYVGLIKRIESLEAEIAELKKPKRVARKKKSQSS